MNSQHSDVQLRPDLARLLQVCVALGALVFLTGLFVAPERTWASLLLVSFFLLCLGLGGVVFIALHYVTGGTWGVALRRVPEAMSLLIPIGAMGLFAVFIFHPATYPWMGAGHAQAGREILRFAQDDKGLADAAWFKHLWLQRPFFLARALMYVLAWTAFALAFVRNSQRQDADRDAEHSRRNARLAGAFLAVFGVTFWLASYDWVMSLEPEWYSTIFGIYQFAGMFTASVAAIRTPRANGATAGQPAKLSKGSALRDYLRSALARSGASGMTVEDVHGAVLALGYKPKGKSTARVMVSTELVRQSKKVGSGIVKVATGRYAPVEKVRQLEDEAATTPGR